MEEKQTLSDNQKPRRFSIGSAVCTAVLVLSLVLDISPVIFVLAAGVAGVIIKALEVKK